MGLFKGATPKRHRVWTNVRRLAEALSTRAGYMSRAEQTACTGQTVKKYTDARGVKRCVGLKKELKESQYQNWTHLSFGFFRHVFSWNIYIYICVHVPVKLHISISGITLLSLHPSFAIKLWSLDMTFGVISISFLFFCEQWTLGWIMSLCWMVKCHCHHMLVFTQDSNWSFCRGLEQIYIVHTCGSLRNWWMRNRFLHRLRNGPTLTLAWPTLRSSSNTAFPSWLGKMRTGGLKRLGMKHAIVILSKNLGIWHTYIHGMTPGSRTCVSVSSWLKRLLKLVAICQYSSLPYQMDNCSSLDLVTHKTWRFLKPFTHLRLWPAQADIWPVLEYLALSKNTIVPGRWVSWTNPGTEAVFMILCVHLASGMAPWPIWANWSTWNGFTPWHPR